jgi:hypothetical protein
MRDSRSDKSFSQTSCLPFRLKIWTKTRLARKLGI